MTKTSYTFNLNLSQQDIYFDQLRHPESPIYNVGGYIRLGAVNVERIGHAHRQLVLSDTLFGLRIIPNDNGVKQHAMGERNCELPLIDMSETNANEDDAKSAALVFISEQFHKPFPIADAPLYKSCLIKLSANDYWYFGITHHLMMDGWGFSNWARKLGAFYHQQYHTEASSAGDWQQQVLEDTQYLQSEKYQKHRAYWRSLKADVGTPFLSAHYAVDQQHELAPSGRIVVNIPAPLRTTIEHFNHQHRYSAASLFNAVLACYALKAYEQEKVMIGVATHNRKNRRKKLSLGVFTNISLLSIDLTECDSFFALLKHINSRQKQLLRNARFPTSHILRELGLTPSQRPYDMGLNYLKFDSQLSFAKGEADIVYVSHDHERTPLMFNLWEYGQRGMQLQLDYNLAYFSPQEASALTARIIHLLSEYLENPSANIRSVSPLPAKEAMALSAPPLQCGDDYPLCVEQWLSPHFSERAEHSAVRARGEVLSFRALDKTSTRIAQHLIALGVQTGDRVGVSLSRHVGMVASVLALFKCRAVYVPLDSAYPQSRLTYLIQDSGIRLILSDKHSPAWLAEKHTCVHYNTLLSPLSDTVKLPLAHGDDIAYLIYTSGSTGQPKGVTISQRNICSMLNWGLGYYPPAYLRCGLVASSIGFDYSLFELLLPLAAGGEAVLIDNILALDQLEPDCRPSLLNTVPSALQAMLAEGTSIPPSIRAINLGGEALPKALVERIYAATQVEQVYNLYGPTECTVLATAAKISAADSLTPAIGKATGNASLRVVNKQGQPLPTGVAGELWIGGPCVSPGYWQRRELNQEKFRMVDGERFYVTGDLVRQRDNGELEYHGRNDSQVKIRGHRIEPGEIEQALASLPQVATARVVVHHSAGVGPQLIAFFITTRQAANEDGTKADSEMQVQCELEACLPRHMWPGAYLARTHFPTTANGKVDDKALLEHYRSQRHQRSTAVTGRHLNDTQRVLAMLWAQALSMPQDNIDVHSNFFTLGGHSLLCLQIVNLVRERWHIELSIKDIFDHADLAALAACIDARRRDTPSNSHNDRSHSAHRYIGAPQAIDPRPAHIPLSFAQQRLWLIDQLEGESSRYNMPLALKVYGALDLRRLQKAFNHLLARHEILRTVYYQSSDHEQHGEPGQRVIDAVEIKIDVTDTHAVQIADVARAHAATVFKLTSGPLLKISWLKLLEPPRDDAYTGVLLINLHHILGDGWSVNILINELCQLYRDDTAAALPALPLQYADYALWQRQQPTDQLVPHLDYWRRQLADLPAVHSLPLDAPRNADIPSHGRLYHSRLATKPWATLQQLCAAHGITPFMLLHASFALLLARHSGQRDIVIGTPVANRSHRVLESLIGFFVNTLVLRVDVDQQCGLSEFLGQVRQVNFDAQAHQDLPFEQLLTQLDSPVNAHHNPLFQIMLSLENADLSAIRLPHCEMKPLAADSQPLKFDLELSVRINDSLELEWLYNPALFQRGNIARLDAHLQRLLSAMGEAANSNPALMTLPMLSVAELEELLPTPQAADNSSDLLSAIIYSAREQHGHTALVAGDEQLSYQQLCQRAQAIASAIRCEQGDYVGICMDSPLDAVTTMLGLWWAGKAFVPLGADLPPSRISNICHDAAIHCLITNRTLADQANTGESNVALLVLEDIIGQESVSNHTDITHLPTPAHDQPAYVIYTSGTSGTPKGVVIEHGAISGHIATMTAALDIDAACKVLQCAPVGVDAFLEQTLAALSVGGTVHFRARQLWHGAGFFAYVATHNITHVDISPVYLAELLRETSDAPSLKAIVVGGEALPSHVLKTWQTHPISAHSHLFNAYGPTETTITTTLAKLSRSSAGPSIGEALPGRYVYLVDQYGQQVPRGCTGELLIGGAHLARGYLGQPKLSAEKFITDPFHQCLPPLGTENIGAENPQPAQQARLYRSGDLMKQDNAGQLHYCGRRDNQIKVRGYRIESDEVHKRLSQLPNIADVAVVLHPGTDSSGITAYSPDSVSGQSLTSADSARLIAYVVLQEQVPAITSAMFDPAHELLHKQALRHYLPEPMVPEQFVYLPQLPLNSAGKLDRKALAAVLPEIERNSHNQANEAPRTATEEKLAKLWRNLLQRPQIGRRTHFFALGGNSLAAVKLTHQVQQAFNVTLSPRDIFEHPELASLAGFIEAKQWLHKHIVSLQSHQETASLEEFIEDGEI